MKKQFSFKARIFNGDLKYLKPYEKDKALEGMDGIEVIVRIEEIGDDVTANQRAYYFATNRWLTKEVETFGGWEESDVDEYARMMFLSESKNLSEGKVDIIVTKTKSIRDLDKDQMREFIKQWLNYLAFTHGIYCPSPEDIMLSKYHD
jgi:hypothetical protein